MSESKEIIFPDVLVAVDNQAPYIMRPMVDKSGKTTTSIVWQPRDGDASLKSSYTDAKRVNINGVDTVLVTRTRKAPHLLAINYKTGLTYWNEIGKSLSDLTGGIHSATYVDSPTGKGSIMVTAPSDKKDEKNVSMLYIGMQAKQEEKYIKCNFIASHACMWIDQGDGPGGGFLWVVGRDTPQVGDDAKSGKCLLKKYFPSEDGDINHHPAEDIILVDSPDNLEYMDQPEYWEGPHDIARPDKNTLWITTESQVLAFDLRKNGKVTTVSNHKLMAENEKKTPKNNKIPSAEHGSATNLKCLSCKDGLILYTQTTSDHTSTNTFCIVKDGVRYDFDAGGQVYKARWA
ncbi:hypothetical protein [Rouxiella sp. WC2420]|uniref:Uncharacterized protein n=1 Tax=Rouxiella sp. WC2420 TaxID=3234145 RepID=A0AB39VM42_9GAMM